MVLVVLLVLVHLVPFTAPEFSLHEYQNFLEPTPDFFRCCTRFLFKEKPNEF
jgi:hypothetical protein